MKLILVRHGETEENLKKISQGQTMGTLSSEGINQAKKLAKRFEKEKIDFIYSSDLQRTKDTVIEMLKYHSVPIIYDRDLRERSKGKYEGRPEHEYFDDLKESGLSEFVHTPPGGESMGDVLNRADRFIQMILDKHDENDTILICTHGGWLNMFMSYILNLKDENIFIFHFKNSAVTIVELSKSGKARVDLLNCVKHLE